MAVISVVGLPLFLPHISIEGGKGIKGGIREGAAERERKEKQHLIIFLSLSLSLSLSVVVDDEELRSLSFETLQWRRHSAPSLGASAAAAAATRPSPLFSPNRGSQPASLAPTDNCQGGWGT